MLVALALSLLAPALAATRVHVDDLDTAVLPGSLVYDAGHRRLVVDGVPVRGRLPAQLAYAEAVLGPDAVDLRVDERGRSLRQ